VLDRTITRSALTTDRNTQDVSGSELLDDERVLRSGCS
jgi:hypothetical protein